MSRDVVAVVTPHHGRHDHLRHQQRSLAWGSRLPDLVVLVGMGDAAPRDLAVPAERCDVAVDLVDGRLPLARARNDGVHAALAAGATTVVCLDVDVMAGRELVAAYADAAQRDPTQLWSGPVTYLPPDPTTSLRASADSLAAADDPHPARPDPGHGCLASGGDPRLFWSLSFACRAATWLRSGGFCEDYVGYGAEDTDLGLGAAARGIGLGWVGGARGYHQHHPVSDPPVEHLDDLLANGATFARRWGHWPAEGWWRAFEERGLVERGPGGWRRTKPGLTHPPGRA